MYCRKKILCTNAGIFVRNNSEVMDSQIKLTNKVTKQSMEISGMAEEKTINKQ